MAYGFDHAAHLAVAALGDGDAVPAVGAFATAVFDGRELRHAVVQLHAFEQTLFFFFGQAAQHPHGVFTLQAKTRVHQVVGQGACIGKKQ